MLHIRVLSRQEHYEAASLVSEWGYPRPIEAEELDLGIWLTYGPDVIWWLQMIPEMSGEATVHVCVRPGKRGMIYPRRLLAAFGIVGQVFGFKALRVLPITPDSAEYLERMGWTPTDLGWYLSLGKPVSLLGVSDGRSIQQQVVGAEEAEADDGQGSGAGG